MAHPYKLMAKQKRRDQVTPFDFIPFYVGLNLTLSKSTEIASGFSYLSSRK
jgi:hypothetical protein